MMNMDGEKCPFEFNFDPETFKVGDMVSYRVSGGLGDFPFVGKLVAVEEDHVVLLPDENDPDTRYRATRESRPVVAEADI